MDHQINRSARFTIPCPVIDTVVACTLTIIPPSYCLLLPFMTTRSSQAHWASSSFRVVLFQSNEREREKLM